MRSISVKIYSLATQHKGAALGIGALVAVLAVKSGAAPDIHYYG